MDLSVPNNKPDHTEPLKAFGMSEIFLALVLAGIGLGFAIVAFVYELIKWEGTPRGFQKKTHLDIFNIFLSFFDV